VTDIYHQRFSVPFDYPVYFTEHVFDPTNSTLADAVGRREPQRQHRTMVVLDAGVVDAGSNLTASISRYFLAHTTALTLACEPIVVPGGERTKSSGEVVSRLYEAMAAIHLDRQSVVAIVGGGAVQDAAGYAASTAHRGIRVVRLPTTVEGQNDSGVGVKNGLNAYGKKNYIGTFAPPFAVDNDIAFIDTLSARDRLSGIAEAVKVALLRDTTFFEWLWTNSARLAEFERGAMAVMIRRSAELHMQHIADCGDPFELGSAKPLDFGHWAAHKLELLSDYDVRHGEAVAMGLVIDSRYAADSGLIDREDVGRVCVLLERLGFTLWHDAIGARNGNGRRVIMDGLDEFREHLGGELTLTMLSKIGCSVDMTDIDIARMERALDWLEYRAKAQ
jgi:3-dehydroquinate synthase